MMRMSAKHTAPESFVHITIQLWPKASIMQRLLLLPIFLSRDSANQQLRQCPQWLLPHPFPPWGIYTSLANPYLLLKVKTTFMRMTMILKNFLPFNISGIAPIFKKIPPLDGSVFGAVRCLSLSMLHVPSIMWFGLKEGVLSLVRLPFQPTILHDIRQWGIVDQAKLTPRNGVLRLWMTLLW
jgi:hypothetical protein